MTISEVLALPAVEAEKYAFERVFAITSGWHRTYGECGLLLNAVHHNGWWKHRFTSFSDWLEEAAPHERSRSQAYAAMAHVRELIGDVPAEDLIDIPQANFDTLTQLPKAARQSKEILSAAKTLENTQFAAKAQREYPNSHIEVKVWLRFQEELSAAEQIETALKQAQLYGAGSRNQALELLAIAAMDWWAFKEAQSEVDQALRRVPTDGPGSAIQ